MQNLLTKHHETDTILSAIPYGAILTRNFFNNENPLGCICAAMSYKIWLNISANVPGIHGNLFGQLTIQQPFSYLSLYRAHSFGDKHTLYHLPPV